MITKKITQVRIAELFGYKSYHVFKNWKDDEGLKNRFEWLKLSGVLIENNFTPESALLRINISKQQQQMIDSQQEEINKLRSEIVEYEKTIDDYVDKMEAIRLLGK